MTRIKFCGMTRAEDVAVAVALGVQAVGFVLWSGSPRHVDVEHVARLIEKLPSHVTPVGVFVRPTPDELARGVQAGIRVAQLHGVSDVPPDAPDCDFWVAASLVEDGIRPEVPDDYTVLIDAHDPQHRGGTGRTIDWKRAGRIAAVRRIMLAGGLTPDNVGEAIRVARPFGVDVASGIEDAPGVKNAHAMEAFVAAVRQVDR